MKKILVALAIALFVVLPLSVNAKISLERELGGMVCTDAAKNNEGKYFVTCTAYVITTENETITSASIDLTFNDPSNIEFDSASVKGSGAFTSAVVGTSISFNASAPQTGSKIELGSFTYYVKDASKDCSFVYTPTGLNIDDPKQTVTVTPVENPETGSAVSYIAIGAGVLLVAGAYVLSRKNTKMYNV